MQRVRVSPRLEAGGWGVQRHSARQVDRGGRGAEGGDQAARGEVGREQWGVEGSSGKQGKRLLIFPPSDLFLSCRLFFPITLAFQSRGKTHCWSSVINNAWLVVSFMVLKMEGHTVPWNRRSWRPTSRWRRTASWSTSRSAWACVERCRTTLLPPGTSSHCHTLAIRCILLGPGAPFAHLCLIRYLIDSIGVAREQG